MQHATTNCGAFVGVAVAADRGDAGALRRRDRGTPPGRSGGRGGRRAARRRDAGGGGRPASRPRRGPSPSPCSNIRAWGRPCGGSSWKTTIRSVATIAPADQANTCRPATWSATPRRWIRLSSVGTCPPAIARPHDSPRIAATSARCAATTSRSAGRQCSTNSSTTSPLRSSRCWSRARTASRAELTSSSIIGPPPGRRASSYTASMAWSSRSSYRLWRSRSRRPRSHVGCGELGVALEDVRSPCVQAQVDGVAEQRVDEVAVVVLALLPAGGDRGHRRARRGLEVDARRPHHVGQRRRQALRAEQRHRARRGHRRVDLDHLADLVEHPAQVIEVGVLEADPRVGHVAGLDRLGRRPVRREVMVDDPFSELLLHRVQALVAGDDAVVVGAQRDDAGGEAARQLLRRPAVHDGHRPLAVDVDVVADGVQVPRPHARRPAADLGELQALGAEEPLHVRRRRADAERLVDRAAERFDLVVHAGLVDAVGGDELRRDPARGASPRARWGSSGRRTRAPPGRRSRSCRRSPRGPR